MEEQWLVDRTRLRQLLDQQATWSTPQLAQAIGRSRAWVKKWVKRLRAVPSSNAAVLHSRSRARHYPPPKVAAPIVTRILDLRDNPPEGLRRTPGPKAILYYLHRDEALRQAGYTLPRGTRVIWQILRQHQRVARPPTREPATPREPVPPGEQWGLDFKDVTSVPATAAKQQHVVEILNVVDHGDSSVVASVAQTDYTAETSLRTVATLLAQQGCPKIITLDRDPRWVGSWRGLDFPSAFLRFLAGVGIVADVCPPQRPDLNPYVERYHRNLKAECLVPEQPTTLAETETLNAAYVQHYNTARPNQARSCGNQPPRTAHPQVPVLRPLPTMVDPDAWLAQQHGQRFKRRVDAKGQFQLGKHHYYVRQALRGQWVTVHLDAPARTLQVEFVGNVYKVVPIKGLYGALMPYPEFLNRMAQEAQSEWQHYKHHAARYTRVTM